MKNAVTTEHHAEDQKAGSATAAVSGKHIRVRPNQTLAKPARLVQNTKITQDVWYINSKMIRYLK